MTADTQAQPVPGAGPHVSGQCYHRPHTILRQTVGFDKVPWPLLPTILTLPQLSIMISLQVSANRAQA